MTMKKYKINGVNNGEKTESEFDIDFTSKI